MKILVTFTLAAGVSAKDVQALLLDDERFAWRLYLKGVLREYDGSDMPSPAVSVVEMKDVETAKRFLEELPLLKCGLITAQYYPLYPFHNWEAVFRVDEKIVTVNRER